MEKIEKKNSIKYEISIREIAEKFGIELPERKIRFGIFSNVSFDFGKKGNFFTGEPTFYLSVKKEKKDG